MQAIKLVQAATSLVVSGSVGLVVTNVIKSTNPDDLTRIKRIGVGIGTLIISGTVGEIAATMIDNEIEKNYEAFANARQKIRDQQDLIRQENEAAFQAFAEPNEN